MSEANGLINAFLLDGHGFGSAIDWDAIRAWNVQQGTAWIHLDFTNSEAQQWLLEESGLNRIVAEALIAEETRPRCEAIGDGLLICLRGVNSNPGADPEDMVSIRIYATADRIISTRKRRLLTIQDIVQSLESGTGPENSARLISMLAVRLIERMSDVISDLDERIDTLEEAVLAGAGRELQNDLLELRREILKLRRYLSPQRDALAKMQNALAAWLDQDARMKLREAHDKVMRYLEDLDSARDRASVAHEALSNQLAEQMNSRMYLLSLVAGLFLPLGFVTGLLGINVGGIPLADDPYGFLEIVIILIVLVTIQIVIFMRKKWF